MKNHAPHSAKVYGTWTTFILINETPKLHYINDLY
jgi:hypothetical protein